jgi:hypothetical protein
LILSDNSTSLQKDHAVTSPVHSCLPAFEPVPRKFAPTQRDKQPMKGEQRRMRERRLTG